MTDLTDKEKSQVQAETASVNKIKAKKLTIQEVMRRVEKQDGVGIRPEEVWCLYFYIESLEDSYNTHNTHSANSLDIGR